MWPLLETRVFFKVAVVSTESFNLFPVDPVNFSVDHLSANFSYRLFAAEELQVLFQELVEAIVQRYVHRYHVIAQQRLSYLFLTQFSFTHVFFVQWFTYLYAKCLYVLRLHKDTHKPEKELMRMENEAENLVRERVSITLPKECISWLDRKIESRVYANRSHALEVLILEVMKQEKKQ